MSLQETSVRHIIPWARPVFAGREKEYVEEAFASTRISGGHYIERFEREFAAFCGSPHGLAVNSGTSALYLALRALGLGPGDEVIVPGFTFVAPVNMVLETGATPVYADVDPLTWCLDPVSAEGKVTGRTRAILPVHLYGNVCHMQGLLDLARSKNLRVVEDAAQAAFSSYQGRYAGTWGDMGCFSFHATKTIFMGEGGGVLTSNKSYYEKMLVLRDHGMRKDKRYWHDVRGYNFRLTNFQAAVGCAQLEKIEHIIDCRRKVYGWYCQYLDVIEGVTLQVFRPEVQPVVWTMAVRIDPRYFKGDRDFMMEALGRAGIETRPGFYPVSAMELYQTSPLPVAEEIAARIICLPFYSDLSEEQVVLICEEIKKIRA